MAIPGRITMAMKEAAAIKDTVGAAIAAAAAEMEVEELPEAPVVVFVNAKSGGRHGPMLKDRLQHLIGEDQVSLI